ncbi:heavy-metal-associated domain-containing protein [Clostridium sp. YIM B02505]|uniref:Heavy-metal-associated domain-containing protein n=1 Tax=Clostridium yunnanense TaxID=2800325 RepID=A0ABS1ET93_9CLOT|nr:heavy-metal-associated domain-containing protein [Clostridium yunnanense]MBK1812602.1 heavy-metal-associated domain-containing protein [Clostridium yunnanense]
MKSSIKIPSMKTSDDIIKIKKAISSNEGVIACEISKEKGEVNVVYDNYFVELDDIITSIEDLGYIVL